MKKILVELDDRCARDLERVAPTKKRVRAEFIRLAIRRAVDLALDRATEEAYRASPLDDEQTTTEMVGWDEHNTLAQTGRAPKGPRRKLVVKGPA